jgi:uncharacterized membrane protein YpjA
MTILQEILLYVLGTVFLVGMIYGFCHFIDHFNQDEDPWK